jgi:hypothetical protein
MQCLAQDEFRYPHQKIWERESFHFRALTTLSHGEDNCDSCPNHCNSDYVEYYSRCANSGSMERNVRVVVVSSHKCHAVFHLQWSICDVKVMSAPVEASDTRLPGVSRVLPLSAGTDCRGSSSRRRAVPTKDVTNLVNSSVLWLIV